MESIKFQITYADGTPVSDAVGTFQLFLLAGGTVMGDPLEVESTSSADTGNTFRYSDPIYIFNLNTDGIAGGLYRLIASLNDGLSHAVDIGFK